MATRRGMGKGMGMGYKNLAPRDPFVHRLSQKGVKTVTVTAKPILTNIKHFIGDEFKLTERYLELNYEERYKLIRDLRRKQLEKKKKFLEHALSQKWLDVKEHNISDMIQGFDEAIVIKNPYGKKVIHIKVTEAEKKRKDPSDKWFAYAQTHRVAMDSPYWKQLRNDLTKTLQKVNRDLKIISEFDNTAKMKKFKKGEKINIAEAFKQHPMGRMLETKTGIV